MQFRYYRGALFNIHRLNYSIVSCIICIGWFLNCDAFLLWKIRNNNFYGKGLVTVSSSAAGEQLELITVTIFGFT